MLLRRDCRYTPKEACSKFISYWFNTVSAYTESYTEKKGRQLENKPPVFLVGTHRGPYDAEDSSRSFKQLSEEEMRNMTGVLEDHFENSDKCGRYVPHITSKSYNFVESSLKGKESGAQVLRSRLRDTAKSLPYMKEKYPVRVAEARGGPDIEGWPHSTSRCEDKSQRAQLPFC